MATIYDLASSSSDSIANATNFSTNYAFNVMPNALGIPYEQDFQEGMYAFANYGKDEETTKRAHTTFGKYLPSQESADYWVGSAYVNQLGYQDITQAYIALDIPIPENAKDQDSLYTTLGRNILDSYRKQYDERAAIAAQKTEKAQRHYKSFFLGTLDPAALDPQELKDFTTITGFAPSDVIAGGKAHRASQNSGIFDKLEASLARQIKYAFFNSDYNDTAKEFRQYADTRWDEAWGNKQEKYARIIQLAENPSKAIQVAAQAAAEQERANIKDSNFVTRTFEHIGETANELVEGGAGLTRYIGRASGIGTDTTVDHRQGERLIAALDEAKETETAQYNEQNGLTGLAENITRGVTDIAPFANIVTAIPSMVDMFTKNAGRSYSAIAKEDGSIPSSASDAQVYGKAAADALINYGTRAVGMKYFPKVINRGLTKVGVNSTLGHYAATSLVTGANFATVVPAMDASLRAVYDAVAVSDPRLKNGVDSLKQWWNKDIPSLRYWMTQAGIGAVMGASGTLAYHRSGQFLALKAEMSGLTKQEADSMRRSTPLEDLSDAYQKAIKEKLDTNPQQAIDTAIANTRQAISDEEARLAEENGHRARIDAAKQATLRFYGITLADGKDADHVNFLMGGSIDPMSGKYIVGSKTVELNVKDADLWLGSLFQARAASRTKAIRNAFGVKTFLDAALSHLKHQVKHEAVLDPLSFNEVIENGSKAQAKIKKLTKSILDKSKGQDGKPALTEAQARAQAEQTKQGNSTLKEIVNFAKEAQKRMEQEQATNLSHDPDASFFSNVYVISKGSYENGTLERVFRIAYGATPREMIEDYAEQWMKDYIFEQRIDYTDLWRELHSLNQYIKGEGISATTLQNRMPQLAQRLLDENQPLTSDTIDNADEAREIRRDIIEGMSNLHLANLAKLAQDGKLPAAFQPLLDSKLHSDLLMEQDMALAAALDLGRSLGKFKESAARLFDASAEQIQSVMDSVGTPTVDTYYDTYVARQLEYQALMDNPMGLTADLVEATLAKHAKAAEQLAKQIKAEDERQEAEALAEIEAAEADPANEGKSRDQIINEIETQKVEQFEFDIVDNPASVDGEQEIKDDNGIICKKATLNIADLTLMPNFKTGSSEETGEVHSLKGEYHKDHDPIRVMERTDGSLMVFSGRHRLAHAKRYNVEKIEAYVYKETEQHNLAWARLKDIEWNIKDNQATAEDIALLIRGELIDGIPALTNKECEEMGIVDWNEEKQQYEARENSAAYLGYQVGAHASQAVMTAFKNGQIDMREAAALSFSAPSNDHVQRVGLGLLLDNKRLKQALFEMDIEKDKLDHFNKEGVGYQLNLFGEAELDPLYDKFVKEYSQQRITEIQGDISDNNRNLKLGQNQKSKRNAAKAGIIVSDALHGIKKDSIKQDIKNDKLAIEMWKHPYTNTDTLGEEINAAFAKAHPEEWKRMQERKAAMEAPIAEDSPDLGNTVQGDVSNVKEFDFSVKVKQGTATIDDAKKADLFNKGHLETANALVVEPNTTVDFSITAYHASPHNFRKFTTDKMGSGEGAQAFGWGLYFAESKAANRSYFTKFSRSKPSLTNFRIGGQDTTYEKWTESIDKIIASTVKEKDILEWIKSVFDYRLHGANPDQLIQQGQNGKKLAMEAIKKAHNNSTKTEYEKHILKSKYLEKIGRAIKQADIYAEHYIEKLQAVNYQVELNADDSNLLMWDDYVSKEFVESFIEANPDLLDFVKRNLRGGAWNSKITGEEFYKYLWKGIRGKSDIEAQKEASMMLSQFGIKGIKYLDGFSRKRGEGSYNYVIFDGKDIKITAVNETGIWSMDEGWESYTDPTADFSITARERIEQNRDNFRNDPSFGLGQLGTFESIMLGKFKPTYDDLMDARLATMIKAVERRMRELDHVYDKNQSEKFMAEMQALLNQLTTMLPKGFSFGLEAYQSIIATYATLRKTGDPDAAAAAHPVEKWQEIMAKAFRNQFDRLLNGKLSEQEEEAIVNRFPYGLVTIDLSKVKKDLDKTRREYYAEVNKQFNEDERSGIEYRQARAEAREHAYQDVKARHQAAFEDAYQKLAAIRADKLMGKFLDRVYLKLNQYRKQRIVNKILRALYSITPTKVKNGKPVKGTVEMSTYNTIRDNFRLLNLTKAQKDAFEEDHPELADAEPESTIDVPTYDEEGNPITLKVTKQQYDTYASMETMSADTLNETAKALGTLIAQGKEAWQLKAEAQRAEIENFCAPIYDKYAEAPNEKAKRLRKGKVSAMSGNSRLSRLNKILPSLLNDADLIDTIASVPGLQQFKKVQDRIAEAHIYMETSEARMKQDMTMAALNAIGIKVDSPLNLTAPQTEALINFCNDKVAIIKLDKPITFTVQPPDFEQQQRDIFRNRFLKHMRFVKDKKNFNPDELAYALQIVKDNIPADIFEEAMTRFGNEGDSGAYKGDTDTALNNVFPIDKFGQLRNLNKSIKEAAEAKLAKWQEQLKESKIAKSFEIDEITREEAAYKVLMTEQPDLAETLHQQGYTDEVVKQLKAIAGKEMMAYAYALRDHLNARLPMLQQVYEATYGTPFPAVTNYFRAFFDTSSQEKNAAASGTDLFTAGNLDSKSMRLFYTRVKHNKPLHPTMTVSEAFAVAYKQQSNILAYSDPTTGLHLGEMLNKVMAYKRGNVTMKDTLDNAITADFRAALQDQIANMYRIYGESEASEATPSRLMSDLSTSQAFGILAWRMASLFKNGMAFFNTLGGTEKSSIRDWFKNMHTAFTNTGAITAKEMMQDPLIRDRFKGWDLETYGEALLQAADVKTSQGKKILGIDWNKFSKRGLAAFGSLDRWFTNRSAVVQFNATYSRLKKDNPALPESILREEARNAVKESLGVKGQPMDFRQRPLATTKNRWLLAPYFFLGGEAYSTVGNLARLFVKTEFRHLIDRKDPERAKQARRNLATLASVWMVNGFAYSLMNLGVAFLLDDEETWRKRNIWSSLGLGTLLGPIAGMPIISNLANEIIKELSGSYWLATPSYLPMQDIVRTYREFMDIFDEDSSTWDVIIGASNTARNLAALALLGFLRPVSKAKAATKTALMASAAVLNIFDTAARAARAADERLITPVPEKPQKGVKMSKQSRELNKELRKHNADDLINFTS